MKEGTRIKVKDTFYLEDLHGKEGITLKEAIFQHIQFDKPIPGGHDACGLGKAGHCWYVPEYHLEIITTKN